MSFTDCFAIVVDIEGSFTANQADPGNWTGGQCGIGECRGTKWGISAAAYPHLEIAALTTDDAREIYKRSYWDAIKGDQLPPALALLVFDAAVNSGTGRAIRWLQTALGVTADGQLGPGTMAALDKHTGRGATLCSEYMAERIYFTASLPTWPMFGRGWSRRLASLPYLSMGLT